MTDDNLKPGNIQEKPPEAPGIFELIWWGVKDIPALMRNLKFAIWVLIILSLFTLAGTILPQQNMAPGPEDFARHYTNIFNINRDDGVNTPGEFFYYYAVVPLELYRIFETPLYFILLFLLGISSILCAWDRMIIARKIIGQVKPVSNPESIRRFSFVIEGTIDSGLDSAVKEIETALRYRRIEKFVEKDESGAVWFFVRKNVFRYWASVLFHFAFALILIGGIVGDNHVSGYEGNITLLEGEHDYLGDVLHKMDIAEKKGETFQPDTSEFIELTAYENIYRESDFNSLDPATGFPVRYRGTPSDFVSYLSIFKVNPDNTDTTILEKAIEVNHPMTYKGVSYFQTGVNTKLHFRMNIPGQSGYEKVVFQNQPFEIPELGLVCTVTPSDIVGGVWEAKDGTRTEMPYSIRLVDYYQYQNGMSEAPILVGYVGIGRPLSVGGMEIYLEQVEQYSIIQYARNPGVPIVFLGGFLMMLGLTATLYMPFRRGRIMLSQSGGQTKYIAGGNWQEILDIVVK